MSIRNGRVFVCERLKNVRHYQRKNIKNFVKISEKLLDKTVEQWYHNRACVGILCAYAMMQEIASEEGGNFCGVCPVIGRLNCFCFALRISLRQGKGRPCVGHFSWLGMIRTAA